MADPVILTTAFTIGKEIVTSISGSQQPAYVRCPGQPSDDAVAIMLQRAPQTELDQLRRMFEAMNLGNKFTSPYQIAYEAYGGNNCNWYVSAQSKAMYEKFNMLMKLYGPPGIPLGGETVAAADVYAANQPRSPSLGDVAKQVGTNILEAGKNILTATATGAAQGATVASQGASTGSSAGATAQALFPLLLVAAGVGAVMLLRRR